MQLFFLLTRVSCFYKDQLNFSVLFSQHSVRNSWGFQSSKVLNAGWMQEDRSVLCTSSWMGRGRGSCVLKYGLNLFSTSAKNAQFMCSESGWGWRNLVYVYCFKSEDISDSRDQISTSSFCRELSFSYLKVGTGNLVIQQICPELPTLWKKSQWLLPRPLENGMFFRNYLDT